MAATAVPSLRHRPWAKVLAAIALVLLALVLLVAFFPWDLMRGPINRYVSNKTGRHFEITRHLDVKVGRTTRVVLDGIEIGNPDWAQDRHLLKAERAEFDVRLLPLLQRRIELPYVKLTRPELGLQIEPDGRRTWVLDKDNTDDRNVPTIGAFVIDQGSGHYVARHQGADIRAEFAMQRDAQTAGSQSADAMPLRFKAQGRWQNQPFNGEGRAGDVLYLSAPLRKPFPVEVQAATGGTQLRARGFIASLATFDGADLRVELQGPNLAELYRIAGVVLPDTPRYAVAGQLSKDGPVWRAQEINAKLGNTDMAGELAFDPSGARPLLTGRLQSRSLDFQDLAPLIGMDDERRGTSGKPAQRKVAQAPAGSGKAKAKAPKDPNRKVLPGAPLDVSRLKTMDADVRIAAARVVNAKNLPLDRMSAHVQLKQGVLVLDPLDLGVAGGKLAGRLRIDANAQPVAVQTRLDARSLELSRLLPKATAQKNFGKLQGQVDLVGRGNSMAQLLGTSNGSMALLMGRGQISNILLEIAGLDGGEVLKFLLKGDNNVDVRCAAIAFDVQNGLMTSRALLLDTADTVFHGNGQINLARESMDLVIRPYPKDTSILSLRSPLTLGGTFGDVKGGLDKGALAGRAGLAIALGAINPLLALAATIETGPGHDADCAGTLKDVSAARAEARMGGPAATGPATKPAPAKAPAAAAQDRGTVAPDGSIATPGKPAAP